MIENISVLFTDLVGSTELAAGLTREAGDVLRRGHFSLLRRAIVGAGGSEVKNLGDGLMVVFPAASAALACAVAMQQAIERDNATAEHPVGLRIGVSTGEATREAQDYFGDPVVEAARLCARAGAGQVLVADLVRASAGRRCPHAFSAVGALDLKGLTSPVEALELLWEPLAEELTAPVPLPARLAQRPGVGVIGRDEELALLGDAHKRVVNGAGAEVVLVAGEPGAGKSTLVSEVARRAHEGGATVLLGRCDEDVSAPYRPFQEALGHYVAHAGEAVLRLHVAGHGGELARMVPALRQRVVDVPTLQASEPDGERYQLFAAAAGLLEIAGHEAPVVLALEDLHWADAPTLQLLRYLVANTTPARLLLLCTYRDADPSVAHPLTDALAALRREHGASFVTLTGLDDAGVISFIESAAGHDLDVDGIAFAESVYRETDGNPFFVTEVLRHLSETGAIAIDGTGRWSTVRQADGITLPESVRQVIGARVAHVGRAAATVLSTAAVIGRDFELDLLSEATGVGEDDLLDLLDQAQVAGLVREVTSVPGRYGFSHALIQHTLYDDLGATRRARAHHQVATALERIAEGDGRGRAGELARHYLLSARPAGTQKAIPYARRAGEESLAALAPEDALRHFTRALDLIGEAAPSDPALRIDVLTGLGTAQLQAGIPDFRATLLRAAREAERAHDVDRLVAAALANNRGFHSDLGAIDTEKVGVLEAALDAFPASDSAQRARLLATLCCELTFGPLDQRVALAAEAKAMARRLGDGATLARVCNLCGVALRIPSLLEPQLADAKEALTIVEDLGDPVGVFWVSNQLVIEGTRAGEFELADRCLATMKALAEKYRQPMLVWTTAFSEAAQAMLHGDAARSEELANAAVELGTASGQPDAFANYGTQLMGIRFMQGRTGELVDLVADITERHPEVPTFQSVLAGCYLDAGNVDAARRLLQLASDGGFALPVDTTWLDGAVVYARIAIELQHAGAAGQLLALLGPYRGHVPYQGLTANPPVATLLGGLSSVVGDHDEADAYFESGAGLSARGRMQFAAAYTDLLWGRSAVARGDRAGGRALIERARVSAASRGYALLERRASDELARSA